MKEFDFLPDKGVLPVLYLAEIPTPTPMYKCCCALCVRYDYASQQHRGFLTRILNNALAVTACQIKDTTSTDFDTYNEYICINGPELGSYWFSLILMWAENADENMQRKKPFAKFRMLQIEEDKHV